MLASGSRASSDEAKAGTSRCEARPGVCEKMAEAGAAQPQEKHLESGPSPASAQRQSFGVAFGNAPEAVVEDAGSCAQAMIPIHSLEVQGPHTATEMSMATATPLPNPRGLLAAEKVRA